ISPSPAPTTTTDTSHVHGLDESFAVGAWSLKVLADDLGRTYLRITDGQYIGRFVDDDGNYHQANIEAIAAAGLTQGCDPPANDRYCPTQLVSRGAMATFLVRALGLESQLPPFQGIFGDVPAGEWYTPYVEQLYQLGITVGYADGTFQPNGTVSRAEMSVFLSRALGLDVTVAPTGVFTDVPVDAWFALQAEALFRAGITAGCTAEPRKYCPNDPVPRDQMATFLARAILSAP
ncbi:MAG: S-layer homology domain-containing protein, partial [Acidimicrobiia bacterium]|nr:S-layer homology domain-containing protein [Acidimicrobiia bacterium]